MLKDLKNNNHGIVFITVLVIVIVSMVIAMSVLSLNVSQVRSTENELKYLQAETLADGALYRLFTNQFYPSSTDSIGYTEIVGNTTFTITSDIFSGDPSPPGTNVAPLDVSVAF